MLLPGIEVNGDGEYLVVNSDATPRGARTSRSGCTNPARLICSPTASVL